MANFNDAWKITAENEGSDSSYDQLTKWGITKEFLEFHKIKNPASSQFIKAINEQQAGKIVEAVINNKIFNKADRVNDQWIYNIIIDFGFNKPSYCIRFLAKILNREHEVGGALQSLKIPSSWIDDINAQEPKEFYRKLWTAWWLFTINSGTFIKGAAGLANRVWRYKDYGSIAEKTDSAGAKKAFDETTHPKVKQALKEFLSKFDKKRRLTAQNTEGGKTWLWTGLGILVIGYALTRKKKKSSKKRR